jgi:ferrous iron transport protein A
MKQTLATVDVPSSQTVQQIEGPFSVRLMEMGITPGQHFEVIRRAPTGFPIEIKVRGYLVSLRREEAEGVITQE